MRKANPFVRQPGILAIALLVLPLGPRAQAEIRWERTAVECPADANTEKVEAVFGFTNAGKDPVTILELKPSCGCTAVTLEKRRYNPGEGGQLKAVFELRGLPGLQQTSIDVITDEVPSRPTILTMRATLPEFITLSPQNLAWTVGEASESKETLFAPVVASSGMQVVALRGNQAYFDATLRRDVTNGKQYLVVKPHSTATAVQEAFFVDAQAPGGPVRTTFFVVRVR